MAILASASTACRSNVSSKSILNETQLEVDPTNSPAPPPIVITVAAPQDRQSFRPLKNEELTATAAIEAISEATSTVMPTAETPMSAQAVTPTPTATPLPTFTPPALPDTPDWEHYWLRRPIREGGTVWTDKVYPYGSTRGGTLRTHHGVEFYVPSGTEVQAAASGTVIFAGSDRSEILAETSNFYGNVIVIELDVKWEGQPVYNLYGHLSEILVTEGQPVRAEELIAFSGASGVADGPHLHFEVRLGQNSVDSTRNPLLWLYPFPDRGVVAGRISWPDGQPAREVPVTVRRIDAPSPYAATTTYADDGVNPDDTWNENFAIDDVFGGFYKVTAGTGEDKVDVEMWVYPFRTNFVEIILEN